MSSVADHRNASGNFGVEILNNLNSVKNMLKEHIIQNFIPINVKQLLAQKHRERLDEECYKF